MKAGVALNLAPCGRGATCSGSDRRDRTDGEHESSVLAMLASA